MYLTDGESNFDTHLTPTYLVGFDPSEPTYLSVIRLTSDSSSSLAASRAPPSIQGHGFIHTHVVPYGRGCGRARHGG